MDSEVTPETQIIEEDSAEKIEALDAAAAAVQSQASAPTTSAASGRVEVSAQTITRMMGLASTTDLKLLEGRVDLLTSKVSSLLIKVDRVLTMFSSVPTPSDIGRLEIQLGSIKSMLRETLEVVSAAPNAGAKEKEASSEAAQEQNRKLIEGIRSSTE